MTSVRVGKHSRIMCLTGILIYTTFLMCSPRSHLTSERWPRRQRKEHKVITSKSPRVAYVKPETIGKSAVERAKCGSQRSLCPRRVCQRHSYHPLWFPHKKKINSTDYQASIKYLLLTCNWEKLRPCPEVINGWSNRGKGHSKMFF